MNHKRVHALEGRAMATSGFCPLSIVHTSLHSGDGTTWPCEGAWHQATSGFRPTAGRCMKLRTRKSRPTIHIRRTVKSAGSRWTRQTAQEFRATKSSRCQMARMF